MFRSGSTSISNQRSAIFFVFFFFCLFFFFPILFLFLTENLPVLLPLGKKLLFCTISYLGLTNGSREGRDAAICSLLATRTSLKGLETSAVSGISAWG